MLRRMLFFTLLLAILVPGFLQAQDSTATVAPALAAQADARLSRWFDANQPGAAVLLMQGGKVLFKKGYGLANVELNVPIQPDMVFRIGSVTKQFTAAAVMLLVEEGKVDPLDCLVRQFIVICQSHSLPSRFFANSAVDKPGFQPGKSRTRK